MPQFESTLSAFSKTKVTSHDVHQPIRAELYSVERLEQYAVSLAEQHKETHQPKKFRKLRPRLEENGKILLETYKNLADAIRRKRPISPAAEWLVDNFHIIEEQIREIREDLPDGFYKELPKLKSGVFEGYPRIYAIAYALTAHTDSRFDIETLRRFLVAYQTKTPLNIGELWALVITLRIVLVENLRRIAARLIISRLEREEADTIARNLLELAEKSPELVLPVFKAEIEQRELLGPAFVVQVTRQLREHDPVVAEALKLIETRLRSQGENLADVIQTEHQRQAATQVTIGNIITSMRLLSTGSWQNFFESVSLTESILGRDPANAYKKMDFDTRDRYRNEIEQLSKRSAASELEVAEGVVKLSENAASAHPENLRETHIGFYLIDDGLETLENQFNYKRPLSERATRVVLQHPTLVYLGCLAALTAAVVAILVTAAARLGASTYLLIGFWMISIIPASDFALSLLNWNITLLLKPNLLPSLDTDPGIPSEASTMVVVPTFFSSKEAVRKLLDDLEVYYLANRDENIYFSLLGDLSDSDVAETENDPEIIDAALEQIENLNNQYTGGKRARFYLFCRRRLWNPNEHKWMGWERKRGKLHEFNRLLRGSDDTSFDVATAGKNFLASIRYVITLDADTQLPRDAARRLVGIASHPLNRPHFDPRSRRVTKGYSVLQPRIAISPTSAGQSNFSNIFSGNVGVDPYSTASSDVYQDLFGEGIFTGKGIYDVDIFGAALEGRVPENAILSHDLFEGLYARCGLVTNIELIDDFPSFYDSFSLRAHRWVRGDWQIARWILPHVPDGSKRTVRNHLPIISRWKIFDNLRRSLVAPSVLLWLISVWTLVPGSPFWWTLFTIFLLGFPVYAHLHTNLLLNQPRKITWKSHFLGVLTDFRTNTARVAFSTVCMAHQAYLKTDAILRTLYRMMISRRDLLEWTTAAQAEFGNEHDLRSFLRLMWPSPFIAVMTLGAILRFRPEAIFVALPFLLLWVCAPLIAYQISRRSTSKKIKLSNHDQEELRLIARRTWRFFEDFVNDENNWLPPDNFQVEPEPVIAHRTSPTNIGLSLLSTIAARDLGYLGVLEVVDRVEMTLDTLDKLKTYNGQFLNWYDTRTLEPLKPEYISTVDSGNLAGHIIALKQALVELPRSPIFGRQLVNGLIDTVKIISDEVDRLAVTRKRTEAVTVKHLRNEVRACVDLFGKGTDPDVVEVDGIAASLAKHARTINDIVAVLIQEHGEAHFFEIRFWSHSLLHQTEAISRDHLSLSPWKHRSGPHSLRPRPKLPEPLDREWREITEELESIQTLAETAESADEIGRRLNTFEADLVKIYPQNSDPRDDSRKAIKQNIGSVRNGVGEAIRTIGRIQSLVLKCDRIFDSMDFRCLMDNERKVFAIGYNVQDERLDNSFYDLLASEARLASFVAIAKGDATEEHWFRLGRPQTPVDSTHALVSWTASMFEYLMPLLVMRDYNPSLLGQTYKAVVERQINYGNSNNVPWGISEAAYNARDLQLNYQYGPFGVPGLGLKRGLSEELVVAPYATALAGMIDPRSALRNFRHLEREEALGQYGFYESIDYTPERVPPTQKKAVVHAYMAHHQGMILVALDNILNDGIMQQRFHDEPIVQATQMLLQERIPKGVAATRPHAEEVLTGKVVRTMTGRITSVFDTPFLPTPRTQILSNGKYSVMMTNAGSGFSQCGGIAVTRWREDTTCDPWGSFCYIRDIGSGKVWSAGFQPTRQEPDEYEAAFSEDRIVLSRLDGEIFTKTEIIVSPEDNAEIRCVSITNHSSKPRDFHLTSYLEVVIAAQEADKAHPAFSNLFIETEFIHANNSLLARRRPRSAKDAPVWAIHTLTTDSEIVGSVSYETDRARFLGRGHDVSNPVAVMENRPLSNTVGAVLDPIFSLRCQVSVDPRETVRIFFSTGIAESRNEALALADKYHNPSTFEREVALAWTRSHVEMRHLNIDAGEAYLYQRLGARILYSDPSLRPRPRVLELNSGRQSDIWAYGISGDLPLVLVRIARVEDLSSIRRLLHGHEYLRLKGLKFDLVIMNDHPSGYVQSLHDELLAIVKTSSEAGLLGQNGGIFLLRADQMPDRDRILLHTIARAVIVTDRGSIEDQLLLRPITSNLPGEFVPEYPTRSYPESTIEFPELLFSNGLGGFKADGKEYVTMLGEDQWTPAPWSNIVANKNDFGFQVSETGAGYTWSINSRENRLTPWSNDAVSDPPGEAIYLRDEDTGTVWSPTPLPIREVEPYLIRHGQGYSVFQHQSHGIEQELLMFVPTEDQVKISRLRLRNKTGRKRRISVTSYSELVLGTFRERSAPFLITEIDPKTGTIFARNPFNNEFSERVAFATIAGKIDSATCDRKEFFGRNGSRAKPAAMFRRSLSGRDGAGLDPCAAIKTLIELQPDEEREIIILLGEESSKERAAAVAAKFSDRQTVRNSFAEVKDYWDELLGAIEVKTPDPALDIIVNRWLLYQSLACRVWARTAFYQSGGAIGFRDQLQDVMALVYSHPEITRDQILTAAAHQFKEGDVQHWWHPPTGRGVRTRFSDDLLWLPFVTAFYVRVTGDRSVLDEIVPFIDAPLLNEGQDDLYTQPTISSDEGTVLEHCSRAVDRSLTTGEHGLPLMGSGDWNDGMSSVGNKGKGESVWLGWFLLMVIEEFLQFCVSKEEHKRRKTYRAYQKDLAAAMEKDGWDGQWYRRAFFDDGTPLGSAQNEECRIDSIPQSWGLISGFADRERAAYAMASVEEYLIRRGDGLVLLFTPPFDTGLLDPGYIKGYLPGVRENGGQYTHAAIWTVIAYTILGDGDRAGELFALLNPINHASTRAGLHKYKVEPYVAAGDVYGIASHLGRGGWTWYTGSAGWMYRSAIENILGFTLIGGKILQITPCIPRSWREFEMIYRRERTEYHIRVENPTGVCQGIEEMRLDGAVLEKNEIILSDDEQIHEVKIVLGSNQPASVDDGPL